MSVPAVKSVDRGSNIHPTLISDDIVNTALNGTVAVLEVGGDLADLAPIPGLSAVLGILVQIVKKVQVSGCSSRGL